MLPPEIALLIVWVGAGLVGLWALIVTLILRYHWRAYHIEGQPIPWVVRWYGSVIGTLVVLTLLGAVLYSSSVMV